MARDFDRAGRTIKLGSCTPTLVAELIQRITTFYPIAAIVSEVKSIPRLLIQTERYTFLELIVNSTMPGFATDAFRDIFPNASPTADRVAVHITDPEFNVSYYLVCGKANEYKLISLFQ